MTNEVRVQFDTQQRRTIPTIGTRKKIRVNGRMQTLHVKRVEVEACKEWGEPMSYRGVYILAPASALW